MLLYYQEKYSASASLRLRAPFGGLASRPPLRSGWARRLAQALAHGGAAAPPPLRYASGLAPPRSAIAAPVRRWPANAGSIFKLRGASPAPRPLRGLGLLEPRSGSHKVTTLLLLGDNRNSVAILQPRGAFKSFSTFRAPIFPRARLRFCNLQLNRPLYSCCRPRRREHKA